MYKVFLIISILAICLVVYYSYFTQDKGISKNYSNSNSILIYTKYYCSFCTKARNLLSLKGLNFKEIELSNDQDLHERLKEQTGQNTVPYIFIDSEFIGGFTELQNLEDSGELNKKLKMKVRDNE